MNPLDIALSYQAKGWPVFPCRPADDFDTETGEVLPEKAPLISNGFRGATLNERVIRELWKRNPEAIVGVPTGERIGAWVLDIDNKQGKDGRPWLAAKEAEHGLLPDTLRVETANGGGTHIFFTYVHGVRNRGDLDPGVDVRGEGGFVIAAGSVMADGRSYTISNDAPIADAPQWLLDLVLPPPYEPARHDYTYQPGGNEPYVERAMQGELDSLAQCAAGNRGYQLNASAFSIGQLVAAGAVSRGEAESGLYAAASACGVLQKDGERETLAKIRRGLDAGAKQPREIPKPQHDNDNTRLVDISRMIANGLAKARKDDEPQPQQEAADEADDEPDSESEPEGFHATPFAWTDPKTLPRREFAFGTHYIRKYVSVTVSPGGLGKTSNSIAEALSMTSGKQFLGTKPPQRMRVWLFNAEDPRDEMERRIMAACLHYNLKPKDVDGNLFLDTGREQELVVAIDDRRSGVRIQVPIVEAVVEQIKRNSIDVMIVDPFVSTHQVNENDNGAIDKVAKLWAHIADRTNCSIDVVHHLRKVSDREATVEDARGAVALIGAARSVRVLNRMSEDQATQAGIADTDRYSYFNIHQGKSNLTKMSGAMDWRKLESVPLGNGRGLAKPQDHAGVVTEWKWPDAENVVEGITDGQIEHIKSLVDNGSYKAAPQGRPWAGEAVAFALGLDVEDKGEKRRAATILKALIKEGILHVENERDPLSRQSANFIRAQYTT